MSPQLLDWKSRGHFIEYGTFKHRIFVRQIGDVSAPPQKTLLLLHGFPESSFSFHQVVEGLSTRFDHIVLFDMIGYGLSDKPLNNFGYSLFEQADIALKVWESLHIQGGHLLAHDMGNSVATELLARHENNVLPAWFGQGFQSITFTNGSIVLQLAKLRVTQKILLTSYGKYLSKLVNFPLFKHQIKSAHGNAPLSDMAINNLWENNLLQDGHKKSYLTIRYIKDRRRFEKPRWLPALSTTNLPIHICWGDQDQVARVQMAYYLKEHVCKNATLSIMKGLGHFCQLGNPNKWLEYVLNFYKDLN